MFCNKRQTERFVVAALVNLQMFMQEAADTVQYNAKHNATCIYIYIYIYNAI